MGFEPINIPCEANFLTDTGDLVTDDLFGNSTVREEVITKILGNKLAENLERRSANSQLHSS